MREGREGRARVREEGSVSKDKRVLGWASRFTSVIAALRGRGAGRHRSGRRVTGRGDGSRAAGGSSRLVV